MSERGTACKPVSDAGVTLIDTAASLIAEALSTYGTDISGVVVATKGGHLRPGDESWTVNGSRATSRPRARRR